MGFWDNIKNSFDQDRQYFTYFRVPATHVLDRKFQQRSAQAGLHYFRVWLPAMYLGKRTAWFQTMHPAVHSVVTTNFGGQQGVSIPMLADTTRLGFQVAGNHGEVIARNFPLSPLLPFNGGAVSLQCGLIGLDGYNHLTSFLKALTGFSTLLAVPQFSAALAIANPLLNGIQELVGTGNGRLHLGLMETFTADTLYDGYIAIIRATHTEMDMRRIVVAQDLLWYSDAMSQLQPIPFDHMLLRIEVMSHRDDWDTLPSISGPYKDSLDALAAQDESRAVEHLRAALLAAFKAAEVTQAHRRVIIDELKQRYALAKESLLFKASPAPPPPGGGPIARGLQPSSGAAANMGHYAAPNPPQIPGLAPVPPPPHIVPEFPPGATEGDSPDDAPVAFGDAGPTTNRGEPIDPMEARAIAALEQGPVDIHEIFAGL